LKVEYLTGLSLEGFKQAAHKLPAQTVLLILTVFRDANGRKFVPRDAAKEIAAASSAPAYAVYSSYIGDVGVMGGYVETFESIGKDMAIMTKDVTSGISPPVKVLQSSGHPIADWRQLRRWGIDPALLPDDAELRFYEPSPWNNTDFKSSRHW